jgi:uncharacterized protein
VAFAVTGAAAVGSVVAGRFAGRVPEDRLRGSFGPFVAVLAVLVLIQELSRR